MKESKPVSPPEKKVLYSPLAGQWYTDKPKALKAELQGYLDNVEKEDIGNICAIILPHAGYRYSGQTAAYGVKQVAGKTYSRVIVIGPSHRIPMQNYASIPNVTHYGTPLGDVPLDLDFIARLRQHGEFQCVPQAHNGENSVQMEIPILQAALGEFKLVPIVVGQLDQGGARRIAEVLKQYIDPETLVVISCDFTHYGASYGYVPFRNDIPENIEKLDMGAYEYVKNKDLDGFYRYLGDTGATICGRCSVATLLAMLPASATGHMLFYDTSGRMSGGYQNSVSYMAVAFTGAWEKGDEADAPAPAAAAESEEEYFTPEEKERLLKLARGTLTFALEQRRMPTPAEVGVEITPNMKRVMGAFVTLNKNHNLRGCIGEIFPRRELYKAVMEQAVNAGLNDSRFPRVTASELKNIEFEISALSEPREVDSYNDIVIGKHGMVLRKGLAQAVFLPQVAPEQGWDLATTLTHLSRKAGLPPDAWKSGAKFLVFEAIVFSEGDE